ncbi:MAG: hypothetical protein Q8P59_06150 [Dehalococcoidia bacterium]|nr:hypothetical protein [Dehalococcoidia bacterium]
MGSNWIAKAVGPHPGALRKKLGVKAGTRIPASKLAVKAGDTTKTKRQKNLAKTLKKF